MSNKNETNTGIYTYAGDDPVLKGLYLALDEFRPLVEKIKVCTLAYKEVKGMLNEEVYEDRLADNQLSKDVGQIVYEQESRRSEYFRCRLFLRHMVERFKILSPALLALAQQVRESLQPKGYGYSSMTQQQSLDAHMALGQVQIAFEHGEALASLSRAEAVLSEEDLTAGRAEKAFHRTFKRVTGDGPGWSGSLWTVLPVWLNHFNAAGSHAASIALCEQIDRLLPILDDYEQHLEELERVHPDGILSRKHSRTATLAEKLTYPASFGRVYAFHSFYETELAQFEKLMTATKQALEEITAPDQRLLIQSNCIGARVVVNRMYNLHAGAHNATLFGSGGIFTFQRFSLATFDSFIKKVNGVEEQPPQPTPAPFHYGNNYKTGS